ncbi:MAG: HIT family protein [Bacteroidota bacterium]
MASVFTKIINGEIPCHKILENEKFLAFLDVSPLVNGHVLVVPKVETDYIFDITDADLSEILVFAKQVAKAQKAAITCKRIGIAVIGLEVPHAHVHLVPINSANDLNFTLPKLKLSQDELSVTAEKIRAKL